jgi:hypothetical protein
MTLIPKISRLKKLPALLKQKRDAEERSEKEKQDSHQQRQPVFEIDDEVSIDPETLSDLKIHHPLSPNRKAKSTKDENVGNNIDLTV